MRFCKLKEHGPCPKRSRAIQAPCLRLDVVHLWTQSPQSTAVCAVASRTGLKMENRSGDAVDPSLIAEQGPTVDSTTTP